MKNPSSALFNKSLWNRLFGGLSLTATGLQVQKQVDAELLLLEEKLPGLIKNNPAAVAKLIEEIRGNICLVSCMKIESCI